MLKLTTDHAREIANQHGTPLYLYSGSDIKKQAKQLADLQAPYGISVSYAMKANPHKEILRVLNEFGIGIDASSGYEAERALEAGILPEKITITAQQLPKDLDKLIETGVRMNACSLHQLETYCAKWPNTSVGVRINPGMGSGSYNRVTTGGVSAAFGIWHEYIDQALEVAKNYGVNITQLHTHIGSGAETESWLSVIDTNLELARRLPGVVSMNLGGGFKFNRMNPKESANIAEIVAATGDKLIEFEKQTGRKLELEIEPGTWLVAGCGSLISSIIDVKDTGKDGHLFAILDTGMNDIIRPAMYGAQHPITIFSNNEPVDLLVAGHACESADMFTVAEDDPETVMPRKLPAPEIGDLVEIGGAGAYCAGGFRPIGYNSFPPAPEVFID